MSGKNLVVEVLEEGTDDFWKSKFPGKFQKAIRLAELQEQAVEKLREVAEDFSDRSDIDEILSQIDEVSLI